MQIQKPRMLLVALLVAVVLGTVVLRPAAHAQSSIHFDLGCWGITVGGDFRQSPNFNLRDAVGQWSGGISASPTTIVRSGYIQNWAAVYPATAAQQPISGDIQLYFPLIAQSVRIVRNCS